MKNNNNKEHSGDLHHAVKLFINKTAHKSDSTKHTEQTRN